MKRKKKICLMLLILLLSVGFISCAKEETTKTNADKKEAVEFNSDEVVEEEIVEKENKEDVSKEKTTKAEPEEIEDKILIGDVEIETENNVLGLFQKTNKELKEEYIVSYPIREDGWKSCSERKPMGHVNYLKTSIKEVYTNPKYNSINVLSLHHKNKLKLDGREVEIIKLLDLLDEVDSISEDHKEYVGKIEIISTNPNLSKTLNIRGFKDLKDDTFSAIIYDNSIDNPTELAYYYNLVDGFSLESSVPGDGPLDTIINVEDDFSDFTINGTEFKILNDPEGENLLDVFNMTGNEFVSHYNYSWDDIQNSTGDAYWVDGNLFFFYKDVSFWAHTDLIQNHPEKKPIRGIFSGPENEEGLLIEMADGEIFKTGKFEYDIRHYFDQEPYNSGLLYDDNGKATDNAISKFEIKYKGEGSGIYLHLIYESDTAVIKKIHIKHGL